MTAPKSGSAPATRTPREAAARTSPTTREERMTHLDGTQPTMRQSPPSRGRSRRGPRRSPRGGGGARGSGAASRAGAPGRSARGCRRRGEELPPLAASWSSELTARALVGGQILDAGRPLHLAGEGLVTVVHGDKLDGKVRARGQHRAPHVARAVVFRAADDADVDGMRAIGKRTVPLDPRVGA